MEFRVLGPLEVTDGVRCITLGGPKQRALLTDLIIHANRVVSVERLIDDLWDGDPPATAANAVQTMIGHLRKALEPSRAPGAAGDILETAAPGYRLRIRPGELDVHRFEALVAEGRGLLRADPASAAERLTAALALWRGPALADVAEAPFARAEAAGLEDRRLGATEERVEAEIALGRHADLVGELETLLSRHPLREGLCGQLMLCLYRSGRQAEASAVFHRTRERLADELGMDLGPELQQLFKQILNQDPGLGAAAPAPEPHAPRSNLPHQLTRLVGRGADVETVKELLSRSRLMTLTGPGGIGKTRLALETAFQVADEYPDGVWLAELAPIADAAALPHVVMAALGVRSQSALTEVEAMVRSLGALRCLLLLDNCEHLIEASGQLAETLLKGCPQLRILATSRELLGVPGETIWRVPPLSTPPPEAEVSAVRLPEFGAVQLFLERASACGAELDLNDGSAQAVSRICHRLDGIPLAIELAAARLRMMPIAAIDERLADHFEILGAGGRLSVPRQRTLEATLDWSHELLSPAERSLFRRLGVLAGGFSLSAADRVCGEGDDAAGGTVLDVVAALVDKSLVILEEGAEGMGRYRLLEPIRQYALGRLVRDGERDEVEERHAAFYLDLGDKAEPGLQGPRAAAWILRLEEELGNLRAAFEWALQHDPVGALRLATALFRFWRVDRHTEGSSWIGRALEVTTADDGLRARALRGGCWLALLTGRHDDGRRLGRDCLAIGDRLGSPLYRGWALHALGVLELFAGDTAGAITLLEQAEPHLREARDPIWLGSTLNDLGNCLLHAGDPVAARARVEEAIALARAGGDRWMLAPYTESLAQIEFSLGHAEGARSHWAESLRLASEFQSRFIVHYALIGLARVALAEFQPQRCLRLLGAAAEMARRMGLAAEPPIERAVSDARQEAERSLDACAADRAWREGGLMSLDQAVEYATLGAAPAVPVG